MLGEMEHHAGPRDLRIDRRIFVEAMLPVSGEAQEVELELPGLGDIEDALNGDDGAELRRVGQSAAFASAFSRS